MKKYSNILSLLVLAVYSTLTLVVAPIHHHTVEYVDTPQYKSVIAHYAHGCVVCAFASTAFSTTIASTLQTDLEKNNDKPLAKEAFKKFSLLLVKGSPRRGPPDRTL